MSLKIIGTGHCVPELVLTNEMLSEMVDTSDEWITTRTGINERRVSTGETLCDLASGAARMALRNAGVGPEDIDLIICTTLQGDYLTPSLACTVQMELGAECVAFDVNAACSGFIYGLDVAAAYLDSGRADRVLLIAAEMMSRHLDYTDRATCVLFGDASGAAVLERGDGLLAMRLTAHGNIRHLAMQAPPHSPFNKTADYKHGVIWAGGEVYKFAVNTMTADIKNVLEKSGLTIDDIKRFIPHQANVRIIRSVMKNIGLTDEKTAFNLDRYGNTSSASVATLLSEQMEAGLVEPGDIVLMAAMGGGFTSGACVIRI